MSNKAIAVWFLLCVLFLIMAVALGIYANVVLNPDLHQYCRSAQHSGETTCRAIIEDDFSGSVLDIYFLAVIVLLMALVCGCITWIGALVRQGRQRQWGWFLGTLTFSGIAILIYLLVVPKTQRIPAPSLDQRLPPTS
ncbi:hypothetical protein [Ktedonospora formicarum]|uniref:Uncharacterized protein n=1 Tax=Ktedonospora formicarum TaxID=2778364 RepID=A0A8J3I8K6_9CHLR|nr:hypothetical protein [Ktedonospora formicarum]GHO47778.1 hypothetical protein KSX_59410 [Ktedonospora formicarum]